MTFNKKVLLGTVAAFALAGQANAVTVGNVQIDPNGVPVAAPYVMASELDLTATPQTGEISVDVLASTGLLPSGNIILEVTLTGAEFSAAVLGAAVGDTGCVIDTSVISTGGAIGDSTVRFILSGADDCGIGQGAVVTLPIELTGGAVGVTAGYETEGGSPVDGGAQTAAGVISFASAFAPGGAADSTAQVLSIASEFKDFLAPNVGLATLGTVTVDHTPRYLDLAGNQTVAANVTDVTVTVSGNFAGFGNGANDTLLEVDGDEVTIDSLSSASIDETGAQAQGYVNNDLDVDIDVGAVPGILSASGYSVVVTATYDDTAGFTATPESSASTALEETTREGTTLIFPWTASATLGGSNNLIRIGNLTDTAITGVYARVANQSAGGTATVGALVDLGITIAAEGETVINSAQLEAALGNFGRADVEIVVEADEANLTTRRLVIRDNGGVFDFGVGQN